jgi:hypothetical protein
MWGSILAAAVPSLIGALGQQETNKQNADLSVDARNWQENMRNTAWQSSVKDMKSAGINPMVSYSSGATQTPSAPNVAKMENSTAAGVTSAMAANQMANVEAQTAKTKAETDLIATQKAQIEADTGLKTTSTANLAQQTENLKQQIPKIQAEIADITMGKDLKYQQGLSEGSKRNLMDLQGDVQKIEAKLKNGQLTNIEAQTALTRVKTKLEDLKTSGALNEAEFESSAYGQKKRFIDAGLNSANKAVGIIKPFK